MQGEDWVRWLEDGLPCCPPLVKPVPEWACSGGNEKDITEDKEGIS